MNEYSITDSEFREQPGFWRRQFKGTVTHQQIVFDGLFGIIFPIACFYFDPLVFKGISGNLSSEGFLQSYNLFVYFLSALAITTLASWLIFGKRIGAWGGIVGGVFIVGAILSFLIGGLILPLTILGLMIGIGILGFVPFLTGFVYLRNGVRCLRQTNESFNRKKLIGSALLGATLVIAIPFTAHWKVNQMVSESVAEILHSDSGLPQGAVQRLKYLKWCIDADEFVRAYEKESDPNRKDQLSKAYEEITGESIEYRLAVLND